MRRTIEFTGVPHPGLRTYEVPESLGVWGNQVTVYPGGASEDHVYVDIPLEVEARLERSPEADFGVEMRSRTMVPLSFSFINVAAAVNISIIRASPNKPGTYRSKSVKDSN